jgi:hypothetical protein
MPKLMSLTIFKRLTGLISFSAFFIFVIFVQLFQEVSISLESSQRLCTMEAQLSLFLRICHQYGKHGAQILQSMNALDHLSSCALISLPNVV